MTHTNSPTEQQVTPTSEEELREKLIKLTGEMHDIGFYSYSEETDYVRLNEIDDAIMQLLTSEVEKAKLEARLQEHEMLQHQARVNLKSAEAAAQWSEIRVNQIKEQE